MNILNQPHSAKKNNDAQSAFTLIELLTVITIVGILAAILIPAVGKVRESAKQTASISNLRQIGVGIHLAIQDNKGMLPGKDQQEDDYWMEGVWRAVYPDHKYPGKNKLVDYPGSVYYSPVEEEAPYGYNGNFRIVGDNKELLPMPFLQVLNPAKTAMVADASKGVLWETSIVYRNSNRANVLFVDAHIESLTQEEVDLLGEPFWNPTKYN
ncbi:type II secretion system protein [Coraliomargarita sp. W4R53]